MAEFPIPTAKTRPGSIVAGPDGNLWFTEDRSHQPMRSTMVVRLRAQPPSKLPRPPNALPFSSGGAAEMANRFYTIFLRHRRPLQRLYG